MERLQFLLDNKDYNTAVSLLSMIIGLHPPEDSNLSYFLSLRSSAFSMMHDWDSAIKDMKRCIYLAPDDHGNYVTMGAYITFKHFYTGNFRIDDHNEALFDSIQYYWEGIRLKPTEAMAWLNTIETYIFLMDWDNALCHLGMCKSYLPLKENKLIWTWLTCLTLCLSGEIVEPEDIGLLLNASEQYSTNHDFRQIDMVLLELERINYHPERLRKAKEVHNLYKDRIGAD